MQETEQTTQLAAAEAAAGKGDFDEALRQLQGLSLEAFGEFLLEVPDTYPALRDWLPTMASDEVQRNWTGTCGLPLLRQSCDFVRSVDQACQDYLGHPIRGRVLDYGCGWGRIMRLMLRYVPGDQIYGLDPWDTSIELCRQHRCPGHLDICDYVPRSLPLTGPFDLVYAFSVFTHLSEKTANVIMSLLRDYVAADGLLAITIRPPSYWDVHQDWYGPYTRESVLRQHEERGFAFVPHHRDPIDGDITYGDTSMTLDYIRQHWSQWQIAGTAHNPSDPWQIVVFLQPGH